MNPLNLKAPTRRRPLFRVEAEGLEARQVLSGGAGNTIALIRGTIPDTGAKDTTNFILSPSHFTAPKGRITLGVDVVAATNSELAPVITGIQSAGGRVRSMVYRGPQGPKALVRASSDNTAHAVLANLKVPRGGHQSSNYAVTISAASNTQGDYLLGYYLPGDADGDGAVTKTDIQGIKSQLGKTVDDSDYAFDADANRDGRITRADLNLARQNLGAKTTISPDITANFDPASDTGASDRITNLSTVTFSGVATPGASVSYQEINAKSPGASTTADASGNYSVTLNLAEGTSTFKVTSVDAFGQVISGSIQPVTYTTGVVPQADTTTTS